MSTRSSTTLFIYKPFSECLVCETVLHYYNTCYIGKSESTHGICFNFPIQTQKCWKIKNSPTISKETLFKLFILYMTKTRTSKAIEDMFLSN